MLGIEKEGQSDRPQVEAEVRVAQEVGVGLHDLEEVEVEVAQHGPVVEEDLHDLEGAAEAQNRGVVGRGVEVLGEEVHHDEADSSMEACPIGETWH